MMKKVITVLLVFAMVQLMVEPSQAIDCVSVDKNLIQCISFLKGAVPNPPEACCKGVQTLKDTVTTLADKQFACNCVKNAAAQYQDLKDDAVSSLPIKCGTPLSFPISKSTDCSMIH